jgi:hypothetical protein
LISSAARAELDRFQLGDGHSGALVASAPGTQLNRWTPLAAGDAGMTLAVADSTGFAAGDLVLVIRVTGLGAATSGDGTPIDLATTDVGLWELARLTAVQGNDLHLSAPLLNAFPPNGTQVVTVPEYTTVTVSAGGGLTAKSWDGASGGVLAFLAQGTVTIDGALDVSARGFRGGTAVSAPDSGYGCVALDDPNPAKAARKGEGIVSSRYGPDAGGRGNVANGGGGGVCFNTSGGGGANAGRGGQAGRSVDGARDAGGLGGAALVYSPLERLSFGGGGGAGQANGVLGTSGGAGGGIVFIRAARLAGAGRILAGGADAADAGNDGAGGGGAGGTLLIRLTGPAICGSVIASGGKGGGTIYAVNAPTEIHGPGGGGGGGRVLLQSSDSSGCAVVVAAGLAGTQPNANMYGYSYGALPLSATDPESLGSVTVAPRPLVFPDPPVVSLPVEDAGVAIGPVLVQVHAVAGQRLLLSLDSAAASTELEVPDAGTVEWNPSVEEGPHTLEAVALDDGLASAAALRHFTATGPRPLTLQVGCSAALLAAAPWVVGAGLVLAALTRRRRPKRW